MEKDFNASTKIPRLFQYHHNKEALDKEGLLYMQGQCQIVLEILQGCNGPWTSKSLAASIERHPKYKGKTNPYYVAGYYITRLKRAGVLDFFRTVGEWEDWIAST